MNLAAEGALRFGGMVPEIAARADVETLDHLIAKALADAGVGFDKIEASRRQPGPA